MPNILWPAGGTHHDCLPPNLLVSLHPDLFWPPSSSSPQITRPPRVNLLASLLAATPNELPHTSNDALHTVITVIYLVLIWG